MSDKAKLIERLFVYAVVIILIAFAYFKFGNGISAPQTTITLKYDSIPKVINNSQIEKPVVYRAGQINLPPSVIQILNSQSLDTALLKQIYKELAGKHYSVVTQRTISEDDSLKITTIDTVSENRILGRSLEYKIKFPVQQITVNPKLRNRVYVGGSVQSGVHLFEGINADVYLVTKKNTLYKINYNLLDLAKGQPYSFGGGVGFKIGKWK